MGAFRTQPSIVLHTPRTANLISVNRRIAIIVIYSRSRIPPPLWDLNLGKLCYLVPINRPPSPTSLNTHCEDPSMAYSSAIPRHLPLSLAGYEEFSRRSARSDRHGRLHRWVGKGYVAPT